jgi:3-isopropylmalate dehydrogenase
VKEHDIGVIGGDGIGPEVVREGLKVLTAASEVFGFRCKLTQYPYGTEHFLKTGEEFPDTALGEMKGQDAILLGAIGDPRVEVGRIERAVIMGLRFGLDLFVNLRPIKLFDARFCPIKDKTPDDIDFVVIRENTEDAYAGVGGILKKGTPDEVAIGEMIYTRRGVERVVRYAYELCRKRNDQKRLTLVDKANAIRAQDIWTRVFAEVGREYPEIQQDHGYVDATCMWFLKQPEFYDTIVTTNLFGDIITDLGAAIQGGMGIAASGNIHPGRVSMFEPIHGSAPKYAGKNVANPIATISAVAMMLDYLGETTASKAVEGSIRTLLTSGRVKSLSAGVHKTTEIGDWAVEELQKTRA